MARGKLILIEGLDRSGKSTQAARLTSRLSRGQLMKFPDRSTPIGAIINRYLTDSGFELSDQAAHLLFSANRWELASQIETRLRTGESIVMDRYIYSGIAYSLAKSRSESNSRGKEMGDVQWLYGPDKGLPKPDITLFLTLSLEELSKRKGWGEERYELQEFQKLVRECFGEVLNPAEDSTVNIIDVEGLGIDEVSDKIWQVIVDKNGNTETNDTIEYFQ